MPAAIECLKMSRMRIRVFCLVAEFLVLALAAMAAPARADLSTRIRQNECFAFVKEKALQVVKSGFNAGEGYGEVWIRDYNTFIELSAEVFPKDVLK